MNEETMWPEEREALVLLHIRVNDLIFSHPKVQSRPLGIAERVPNELLTPVIVRAVIRDALKHLSRASQVEEHVVSRIRINGLSFLDWERDVSCMASAPLVAN